MSLQFVVGGSGSGKSQYVFRQIIKRANVEKRNFIVLVPDQFTMQTQMDLCTNEENDRGGIMNIDVLSFSRLSHRIMEELGQSHGILLDDTGKNLILRKVAGDKKEELRVIGAHLSKPGYIHEVKSMLSEFYQYAIGDKELEELIAFSKGRALAYKLQDLKLMKTAFEEYIGQQYITTEGILDKLCELVPRSDILRDSVIVLDGFTGFTPIQYNLLRVLMRHCSELIVTLLGDHTEQFASCGEQDLFALSAATYQKMRRIAGEEGIACLNDVVLSKDGYVRRYEHCTQLGFLEKNLFRAHSNSWKEETDAIFLTAASTHRAEASFVMRQIRKLTAKGYQYRDFAIVSGVPDRYAHVLASEAARFDIPLYMDQTRGILNHPVSEFLRSMLDVIVSDFGVSQMVRFLKCGLLSMDRKVVDRFELYINRYRIRTFKQYAGMFTRKGTLSQEVFEEINALRMQIVSLLEPIVLASKKSVHELIKAIYELCVTLDLQAELLKRSEAFSEAGDFARAKEYRQVYAAVVDLLDQMYALLADEHIEIAEFAKIVEAGLSEITIGTIPQNVDQVVVGDIERTRLKPVKVLFFIGINDGAVPGKTKGGGLLSDMERAFLKQSNLTLAPTPREQVYRQRLYLYMNLTKPSQRLYLSYCGVDEEGASLRKSYLISVLKKLFPKMTVLPEKEPAFVDAIHTKRDALSILSQMLHAYASGEYEEAKEQQNREALFALVEAYLQAGEHALVNQMKDAAFTCYEPHRIPGELARALYGDLISSTVSRLEQFSACAYAHFLRYGLMVDEEQEAEATKKDVGNLYHEVMQRFAGFLKDNRYHFGDFPIEEAERFVDETMTQLANTYEDALFHLQKKSYAQLDKMKDVIKRSLRTMRYQISKGLFEPKSFEIPFAVGDQIVLRGRIDRIDTFERDGEVYIKVVDYKSGRNEFDPVKLYYGLGLQLAIYMKAATEIEQKEHPKKQVIPSAIVYYQFQNPYVDEPQTGDDAEVEALILDKMRMTGLVRQEDEIIRMLDQDFTQESTVCEIAKQKNGTHKKESIVASKEQFDVILRYTDQLLSGISARIYDGEIAVNPYRQGDHTSCEYCAYRSICHFDQTIPGHDYRQLDEVNAENVWVKLSEEGESNGC